MVDWEAVAAEYRMMIAAEHTQNTYEALKAHLDAIRDGHTHPVTGGHLCEHDGVEDASDCVHAPIVAS